MIIDPTGDVTPCCYYHAYGVGGHNAALGNTNSQRIEEIWNGEKYQALRTDHVEGNIVEGHPCHDCLTYKFNSMYPPFETKSGVFHREGHCYTAHIGDAMKTALEFENVSIEFLEDGHSLATASSEITEIAEIGEGRFAITSEVVCFSASDNSVPIVNGKEYELAIDGQRFPVPSFGYDQTARSANNLQKAFEEYSEGVIQTDSKPTHVGYASSVDCNIDCYYCSQNEYRAAKLQLRDETLDDVLEMIPDMSYLCWAGGEPFFLKPFRDFVNNYKTEENPNLLFGFTSNGTMITEKAIEKLGKFTRLSASISIDSFSKTLFEKMRWPAKFDRVIENYTALQKHCDNINWQLQSGLLIMKVNMHEIDTNVQFAIDHGIELNLSPILQYPITERLDCFQDFQRETEGWIPAIDRALEIVEQAKSNQKLPQEMTEPLNVIKQVITDATQTYSHVVTIKIKVDDRYGSLESMRNPGMLFGPQSVPVGYVQFDKGAGLYRTQIPAKDFDVLAANPEHCNWYFYPDLIEPFKHYKMGELKLKSPRIWERFRSKKESERIEFNAITLDLPYIRVPKRRRNGEIAQQGLATPDGVRLRDSTHLYHSVRRREVEAELEAFYGSPSESFEKVISNISPEIGHCYTVPMPNSLSNDENSRSYIELFEDGLKLKLGHQSHDEIRKKGNGRYSHWGSFFYFSSSDNSDPRENGRTYTLRESGHFYSSTIKKIEPESGKCFLTELPKSLVSDMEFRSRIVVYENGMRLGPWRSFHDYIRENGGGSYSHWGDLLYFSSSDGSDPRTNGKIYTVEEIDERKIWLPQKIKLADVSHVKGNAFKGTVNMDLQSDYESVSKLVVLEDGSALKYPHALHDDISEIGMGRYSHWLRTVYFSASDKSDILSNGRVYEVVEIAFPGSVAEVGISPK